MGSRASFQHRSGFTLIEIVLVMALLSFIIGVTVVGVQSSRASLSESVSQLLLVLTDARHRAMLGEDGYMFGVQASGTSVVLVSADRLATSSASTVYEIAARPGVLISLPADTVWFMPYSGRVEGVGSIGITDQKTAVTRVVTVSYEGTIQ